MLHKWLHMQRTEYDCDSCDLVFKSKVSLVMHIKGKYGEGYLCACGK